MRRKREAALCPTCGRHALRAATKTVVTRVGAREVKVRDVALEECAECGERLYDLSALRRIAAARRGRAA